MPFRVEFCEGACAKRTISCWTKCKFVELLSTQHSEELPNIMKLAQTALVLPTNTGGCERGFSAQNRIENSTRNIQKSERLDYLMTTNIEGPSLKEFDFTLVFDECVGTEEF